MGSLVGVVGWVSKGMAVVVRLSKWMAVVSKGMAVMDRVSKGKTVVDRVSGYICVEEVESCWWSVKVVGGD